MIKTNIIGLNTIIILMNPDNFKETFSEFWAAKDFGVISPKTSINKVIKVRLKAAS